ncbi:MAG: DUF748 domain-containing protein [Steroidobacteraceae bacterium]
MGRYRRYIIAAAVVVVLIGAYAAAGFLAVPYFGRRAAVDFVRTHYGRTLSVGAIHFNPFDLNLDVSGLSLPDADGQPLLAFDRLHIEVAFASLWHLAPDFREILLEQPYVRAVVRADGALNLADLGKGFPPGPQTPKPHKPAAPMRLIIQRLAVVSGTTTFEDRTHPTPFRAELKPIAFELRDFSTMGGTGNDYALNAASPDGERLIWSGTVQLAPLASRGQFEIANLRARTLWNYLRASLPFEIDSGVIGIKGDYQLGSGAGPLALTVDVHDTTVTDLQVKPRAGQEDYVVLKRIEVQETRLDTGAHRVEVAKVQLSGGGIKAWVNEQGRLNLLDLVTPPAAAAATARAPDSASQGVSAAPPAATAPAASAAAPAWTVSAPDIGLEGFKVSAEDRRLNPAATLTVDPLDVHVAGFNTSPGDTLDMTLQAVVNSSGKLAARAKVTPATASLTAHLEAGHLPLPALQPYLTHNTSMTLRQGELGLKFDVERRADGSLEARGDTVIRNLSTVDNALKQDFIKWKELRVADLRFRSQPMRVRIGSVTTVEPYVRMIVEPNQTTNLKEILTPSGKSSARAASAAEKKSVAAPADKTRAAAPAAPLTPFPLAIGAVRVVNGAANYTDLWIKPSFTLNMQQLNGSITGLSSDPASRAKVKLEGSIERYSPVSIAGEVNLLSAALYTEITMGVKDLDLTVVNPYSGHFAGYRINKGKLTVDVSYKVEQRKLTAAQHFVIDQLELGDRVDSPDAVHLPLKIAVALLRDRNGVIDLNLPMTGSLDDPHFSIWPLVWKVLVNVIVKAATAPFALLGHLIGGGEHMNIIEFPAGSAALDKPAQDQLAGLAKALQQRPQLKLDVPMASSRALDGAQLARAHLKQELLARVADTREGKRHPDTAGEEALADPQQHFKLLVEQFHADLGKDAPLPAAAVAVEDAKRKQTPPYDAAISELDAALLAHLQPQPGEVDALGKERAQNIQNALLAGGHIDPARVFIVNAPPKPDSGDKVQAELAVR